MLQNVAILDEFVSKPIGEVVSLELVTKQLPDVVVENVRDGFAVDLQVLAKLLTSIGDVVLDELVKHLVYTPYVALLHSPFGVLRGLFAWIRTCTGVSLGYLAMLFHLLRYLPFFGYFGF